MIKVQHVSMRFRMVNDKVMSLKEYMVAFLQHRLAYQELLVLDDINFEIKRGEVVGIIGRNGAGKSTLLKIIAGVLKPSKGTVTVDGVIAPMLELGSGFDPELSGKENIFLNGAILGYSNEFLKRKYEEILDFSELKEFIEMPIRNYSSGMVARLAFAIATVVKPEVLIVDEVLSVGDAGFQAKSLNRMKELMSDGTTVLFVSHSITQIEQMCSKVLWLEEHRVKQFGNAKDICANYENDLL